MTHAATQQVDAFEEAIAKFDSQPPASVTGTNDKTQKMLDERTKDIESLPADNDDSILPEVLTLDDLAPLPDDFEETVSERWRDNLSRSSRTREAQSTVHNMSKIFINDRRIAGLIAHNEFTNSEMLIGDFDCNIEDFSVIKASRKSPVEFDDTFLSVIYAWLSTPEELGGYGISPDKASLMSGLKVAADKNKFNPVMEMLEATTWDGRSRLENFFCHYFNAEDNGYNREIAVNWFAAGVARINKPGCKFDHTIVVEGHGGMRKSTIVEIIARGYYGTLGSQDIAEKNGFVEQVQGCHVIELEEMEISNARDTKKLKSKLSKKFDKTRLAFGVAPRVYFRQFITMGTADENNYLIDPKNNRRFWPMVSRMKEGQEVDTPHMIENIDQVWAEAVHIYKERRLEQPKGDLNLSLSKESREHAETLYSGRRTQDAADNLKYLIDEYIASTIKIGAGDSKLTKTFELDGITLSVDSSFVMKSLWIAVTGADGLDYNTAKIKEMDDAASRCGYLEKTSSQSRRLGIKGQIHILHTDRKAFLKIAQEWIKERGI